MSLEHRNIGFLGPSDHLSPNVHQELQGVVRNMVREVIDADNIIVLKVDNGMTPLVLQEIIDYDPLIKHLKLIMPTRRDSFSRNTMAAASRGYLDANDEMRINNYIRVIQQVRPEALVQLNAPYLTEEAIADETRRFMREIDALEFFTIGMRLDIPRGVRGTPMESGGDAILALRMGVNVHVNNLPAQY